MKIKYGGKIMKAIINGKILTKDKILENKVLLFD